jgi:hypothetical protein
VLRKVLTEYHYTNDPEKLGHVGHCQRFFSEVYAESQTGEEQKGNEGLSSTLREFYNVDNSEGHGVAGVIRVIIHI